MTNAASVPPEPTGWVSAGDAAERLGLAVSYIVAGARSGRFPVVLQGGGAWLRRDELDELVAHRDEERRRWMSRQEVEQLAGCSNGPVDRAVRRGEIAVRSGERNRAMRSLERVSAERWAQEWRVRRRAASLRATAREARELSGPPDDGHVWLVTSTAALIVGVTENWLRTMAGRELAPATRCGRRLWWRRDLVEAFAAARVARRTGDGVVDTRE